MSLSSPPARYLVLSSDPRSSASPWPGTHWEVFIAGVELFPNILEVKNPNFRINVTAHTDFGTQPVLLGSEHHWSMQDPSHVSLIHSFLSSFIHSAYQGLHRP